MTVLAPLRFVALASGRRSSRCRSCGGSCGPCRPRRHCVAFPVCGFCLGLDDPEKTPDTTPWWLLLLRLLAIAAAILAFARPVLNPDAGERGNGPLLVLMDGGWASAHRIGTRVWTGRIRCWRGLRGTGGLWR